MSSSSPISFASLPPIFVLSTNTTSDEMHDAEDLIRQYDGHLSYEPKEARIFLGRLTQKKRAAFELRKLGVWTTECSVPRDRTNRKRKRGSKASQTLVSDSSTEGEEDEGGDEEGKDVTQQPMTLPESFDNLVPSLNQHVAVLKLSWLKQSIKSGTPVPYRPFLVYFGYVGERPAKIDTVDNDNTRDESITYIKLSPTDDKSSTTTQSGTAQPALPIMRYSPRRFRDSRQNKNNSNTHPHPRATTHPTLQRATTSEHELLTTINNSTTTSSLPPPPPWQNAPHPLPNYACHRSTPINHTNHAFLTHLFTIKQSRLLTLDEIGVRAYSTAIASISAYPHLISSPTEITRLPGCSDRIAALWLEWWNSCPDDVNQRILSVTSQLARDEDLKVLKLFYDIWGVGADTARKFYYEHGWKDLDDVVEYGWDNGSLNRVQQIGVKFYEEFLVKIPRAEVEGIADVVLKHARLCRGLPREWWSRPDHDHRGNWNKPDDGRGDTTWDPRDMVCVIVGGYRRGKTECGDVDVILSHRDEDVTKDLVVDVVASLESEGYITHTLSIHTTMTERDQQTLPYRAKKHAGHGFDSLDKALCVWQDPKYDQSKHGDKNPNIHRRVDIIISPWRTVGAAVLGWSGATTFERDIRRWCRREKGWKFDSSGIRNRGTGVVLDFETPKTSVGDVRGGRGGEGGELGTRSEREAKGKGKEKEKEEDIDVADGWEDRERRLMEGLGIGWRPACERCTG